MVTAIAAVASAVAAFFVGWLVQAASVKRKLGTIDSRSKQLLEAAEREANAIKKEKLIEVKDEWIRKRQELDNEYNSKQRKFQNVEKQLSLKEENLDRKGDQLRQQEKNLRNLDTETREKAEGSYSRKKGKSLD